MKIWGIGLSRTGTTTLNETLQQLGFNVIHYPKNKHIFSSEYDGGTDITVSVRFKELDKKFPNSKFIYTVRDKEDWLNSIIPYLNRKRNWKFPQDQIDIRKKVYGVTFPTREEAEVAYDKHHNSVMEYFKDRNNDLLVLDIIDGDTTDKLTKFLNCDPIELKFPNRNSLKV